MPLQVEHNKMDQYGSCFDTDLFDPHGLPEEDGTKRLFAECDRDSERKKAARAAMGTDQLRAGVSVEWSHTKCAESVY